MLIGYNAAMHWQDPVLTAAQIIFIVALLPSILSMDKPALVTSLLNGVITTSIAAVYISFSLWFAAASAGLNSICWIILAIQKYGIDRIRPADSL